MFEGPVGLRGKDPISHNRANKQNDRLYTELGVLEPFPGTLLCSVSLVLESESEGA